MSLLGSWALIYWSSVISLHSFLHSEELVSILSSRVVGAVVRTPCQDWWTLSPSSWLYWLLKTTADFLSGHCPQPKRAALPKVILPGCSSHPLTSLRQCTKAQASCLDLRQLWRASSRASCGIVWSLCCNFIIAQLLLLPSPASLTPSRCCSWENSLWTSYRQISISESISQGNHPKRGSNEFLHQLQPG